MADEDARPRSKSPDRRWQSAAPGSTGGVDPGARRRTRLFLLTALFLILASSVVVGVLFLRFRSPSVYFLAIGIGEYNARSLPLNPFVESDIKRLVQRLPKGMHNHPITNSEKLLRSELKELKDRTDAHLIVYFSALAVVREGKVFVLPADAGPDKPGQWLDIQAVYDALKECPAKQKLLILDLAHGLVDPRLGILNDRVAETLAIDLTKNAPPFAVLVSCSAGQTSLASERLPGSVFAYFLDQALQGRADVNETQTVTVAELVQFVKTQVSRWAIARRGVRQEPRLFGKEWADFAIPYERGETKEPAEFKPQPYPDALKDGWRQRDRLWSDGAFQRAPRPLRRLEANLQRQDDRWRCGAPPTKEDLGNLKALIDDFPRAMEMRRVPPRSLPLAGAKEDPDLANSVARLLDVVDKKDPAKTADELVKLLKSADDKKADFAQQAWAVLQALSQMPQIASEQLMIADAALTKLLDGIKVKPAYEEVLFIRRLARFAKDRDLASDSKYVPALLHTMRSHLALIGALERTPDALGWVAAAVKDADQQRRQAERNLLGSQPRSTWPMALDALKSARATYDLARDATDWLQNARLDLDRAYAWLPAFAQLLCDWPEDDPHHEKVWEKAAAEAATLQGFFVVPPNAGANPADAFTLKKPTQDLKAYLDELDRMRAKRIDLAVKDDTGKGEQKRLCLLANPLLKADERDLLYKQRNGAVQPQDDAESENPGDKAIFPERVVAPLRARMSLALLRVAGVDADPKIRDLSRKTQLNAADLAALERSLREMWGREYPDPFREGVAGPVADRANRLRSPWNQEGRPEPLNRDPTRQWQIGQRKEFAMWLKASYQSEISVLEPPPQDPEVREFYTRAAEGVRP